jgi:uncharacterized membrane protein YeaQ/YmgE (transglycosylase-associated protein family)
LDFKNVSSGRNNHVESPITWIDIKDIKTSRLSTMINIIAWVILGLLAGAISKAIYPGSQGGGILSTMILGIVGAFIGGTLFTLLRTGTLQITAATLSIPGILVAIVGSIIAIYLWTLFKGRSRA